MGRAINYKVAIITNTCSHYRRNFFEKLDKVYKTTFLFCYDDLDIYWEPKDKLNDGSFKREYLWSFWLTKKIRVVPSLIYKIVRGKYDVIIKGICGRFTLPVTFLTAKLFRIPFILWTGLWCQPRTLFHRISFPFIKFIYKYSDALLAYGEHVKEYLLSLGIDGDKIFIATQAVNNSLFDKAVSDDERIKIKEKIGLTDQRVVLFVGRLEVHKGVYYLLDAIADLGNENEDVPLLFIGTGSQYKNLTRIVQERGLKNVFFLGHVDNENLYPYYAIADVLVLPSITTKAFKEPWGMVVNEAMNQGCPVIATEAVGAAAGGLVKDGVNGFIVEERSALSLADAIRRLLNDDNLRKTMSTNSKEMVKQWTDDSRTKGFIDAINFVINNRIKDKRK